MVDHWTPHKPDSEAYRWGINNDDVCPVQTADEVKASYAAAKSVQTRYSARAEIWHMDSLSAARLMPDPVDFVFIDADHRYGPVLDDCCAWWPKVKPGGWIGGHDYGQHETGPEVVRAVDHFASMHGLQVETDAFFTWFCRKGDA